MTLLWLGFVSELTLLSLMFNLFHHVFVCVCVFECVCPFSTVTTEEANSYKNMQIASKHY